MLVKLFILSPVTRNEGEEEKKITPKQKYELLSFQYVQEKQGVTLLQLNVRHVFL